uniref:Uncharacterized protein n=1 Tax=Anopheles farauti TaxID=69004 RepID=A0A182Q6Q0_9DIPT
MAVKWMTTAAVKNTPAVIKTRCTIKTISRTVFIVSAPQQQQPGHDRGKTEGRNQQTGVPPKSLRFHKKQQRHKVITLAMSISPMLADPIIFLEEKRTNFYVH